jgi:hypothetical protein
MLYDPTLAILQETVTMLKKRKPTKALEKCTREIKDSGEFVEHVANIADRYRRERALEEGPRNAEVRKSLREFQKHAAALTLWLQQANRSVPATTQHDAVKKIGALLYGVPSLALSESQSVLGWLKQAEQAAVRCLSDAKLLPRKAQPNAQRIAAEALRATFAYHKLKWSGTVTKTKRSDAVRVLCEIAKSAGTALTLEAARAAVLEASGAAN